MRETEIKRREAERKIRHERLIHDGKKSFFELNQISTEDVQAEQKSSNATTASEEGKTSTQDTEHVAIEKNTTEKQLSTVDAVKIDDILGNNENDLNALDYEADKDDNIDESETTVTVQRVEVELQKTGEKSSKVDKHGGDEKSRKKTDDTKKVDRRRRSHSKDKRSRDRDRRHNSRGRNDRRVYNRRRDYSPYRDNRDNRRRDGRDRFNKRNRSRSLSHDRRSRRNRDSR